ncbi:Hypothetical protein UVM_LOCUS317 [uncultured virus]|nr:Hypothetical protein UVM_LOCUS317 [uncultured virus]
MMHPCDIPWPPADADQQDPEPQDPEPQSLQQPDSSFDVVLDVNVYRPALDLDRGWRPSTADLCWRCAGDIGVRRLRLPLSSANASALFALLPTQLDTVSMLPHRMLLESLRQLRQRKPAERRSIPTDSRGSARWLGQEELVLANDLLELLVPVELPNYQHCTIALFELGVIGNQMDLAKLRTLLGSPEARMLHISQTERVCQMLDGSGSDVRDLRRLFSDLCRTAASVGHMETWLESTAA